MTTDVALTYSLHTMANGLRVLHIPSDSSVSFCGLAINAGSRDDDADALGLAHFVEHTIFKGTSRRRAWHILNRMEAVGGELNAYTTKEGTMLYSAFPAEYLERAIDLIADLTQNSVFPAHELSLERDVVMDEVNSYRDSPMDAAYDDFEDIFFAGSGLGHNILGIESHLHNIDSARCIAYLKRYFTPQNMVLFASTPVKAERFLKLAERYFSAMQNSSASPLNRTVPITQPQFERTVEIGSHQCHTIVGAPLFDIYSPHRHAMALLNNILGGPGMNSLLNVQLRERRGYVYTVESSATLYSDCGVWQLYFGCDAENLNHSLRIINSVISRLAEQPLSERQLDAAKRQYRGQMLLSSENSENNILGAAKSILYHGTITPRSVIEARIGDVTASQIQQMAELLLAPRRSRLTLR